MGYFGFTKALTVSVIFGVCTAQLKVNYTDLISDVALVSAINSDITFSIQAKQPFGTQSHLWKCNQTTTIGYVVNRDGVITETVEDAFNSRTTLSATSNPTDSNTISMNLTLSKLSLKDNGFSIFVDGDTAESNRIKLIVEECPKHMDSYNISIVPGNGDCGLECEAVISCVKGFTPNYSFATCLRNATWSALPHCEPEHCYATQAISCGVNSVCTFNDNNAVVVVNQTTALTCGNGYTGTGFANCQGSNIWEVDINCKEVTCSDSITVPWSCGSCGDFNVAMNATSINEIAEFKYCGGEIVVVCTAGGTWDVVTLCQQENSPDDSGVIIGISIGCSCGGIILGIILCYWLFACKLFPLTCLQDTNCCCCCVVVIPNSNKEGSNGGNNGPL